MTPRTPEEIAAHNAGRKVGKVLGSLLVIFLLAMILGAGVMAGADAYRILFGGGC